MRLISIVDLMNRIRQDSKAYLGELSIFRLMSFLSGYVAACVELGLAKEIVDFDYIKFDEWFRRKIDVKEQKSISCFGLIYLSSHTDAESFKIFFRLLDEFTSEHPDTAIREGILVGVPAQGLNRIMSEIRQRPAIYFGASSLTLLYEFLQGYKCGRRELDVPVSPEEKALEDFQSWLPLRLNVSAKCSWERIILAFHRDEREALGLFFDFYDEFVGGNSEPTCAT